MARPKASRHVQDFSRREFLATTATAGAILASPSELAAQAKADRLAPLDIAEWSFFWTGVERVDIGKGNPVVSGKQMYVEYQIPARVRHPYPIVLVHGGGGQGLDWMGTPDGRRGWATMLLEEGYKVYVVDRPGHGRAPFHPELHGEWPRSSQTLESISGLFTPQRAKTQPNSNARFHTQWPGTGEVGSPELAQLVASQGGAYGNGPGTGRDPAALVWQKNGAELLDKIGPAIIMTHSAGGPFGFYVMEARPRLVKGVVVVEGAGGQAFGPQSRWGLINLPVEYDPPVSDPAEIKTKPVEPSAADKELGIQPYRIQEEPARKLKNWQGIPVAIYTAEASFVLPNPGAVAYLRQAGVPAEEIRLKDLGIRGNGHLMMGEKNNRECLQPILGWLKKNVEKGVPVPGYKPKADSTAMKLADQGYFWVGLEQKRIELPPVPAGKGKQGGPAGPQQATILTGQMYVQYLKPQQKRRPYPVVLVHGGGGQGTHYMGLGDGNSGWAHYYVQAGYDVYIVDRPGHGRAPYHPDALGPITGALTYSTITGDFKRAAVEPNRRWLGTGDVGDPWIDQFQAGQNSAPQDNVMAHKLWASRGAELLDKIGPAIIQVHSAGGPFGFLVANERPNLVKAIVNFEGGGANPFTPQTPWGITTIPLVYDPPVTDPSQIATRDVPAEGGAPAYKLQAEPARKLKNLQRIPITYVQAERSGRNGAPLIAFLKQAGCDAELLRMQDKGVLGNGHFMMLETNRKQAFEVIRAWIESKVRA
jgi:pimeloyl-ACP methyl ester carboxylesterase